MNEAIEQFKAAMRDQGLVPPTNLIANGQIHRCNTEKKNGAGDGSYMLYPDFPQIGGFQNWQDEEGWQKWQIKIGRPFSDEERKVYFQRLEAIRLVHQREEEKNFLKAKQKAAWIWENSEPCSEHPYLTHKGVRGYDTRLYKGILVIPLMNIEGEWQGLQFIDEDGRKRFLKGTRKQDSLFLIGDPGETLCIAEGFATAASIHEATGHGAVVTFDSGNLLSVAKALQSESPNLKIILCADDDHHTQNNPGKTKAIEAAQAVGGYVALPDFGDNRPHHATDFNDLHQIRGLEAVRLSIDSSKRVGVLIGQTDDSQSSLSCVTDSETFEQAIVRLAGMPEYAYEQIRKEKAKQLKVSVGFLDKTIKQERDKKKGDGPLFKDIIPTLEHVNGAQLLTEIATTIKRFIICEDETAHAAALWVTMTWFIEVIQVAPLAIITAPEKRCGKSQLLSLFGRLTKKPILASNISSAVLYRIIDKYSPTLLVDETDSFLKDNEELRGILNSGHTRDIAHVLRCDGDKNEPKIFSTWGAKALSGIGQLPDTIEDRSIIFPLRRKLSHEITEKLYRADAQIFNDLTSKLARFSEDNREAIKQARPRVSESLHDRAQMNWEPLLAIAEMAGAPWPELARKASEIRSRSSESSSSIGGELLSDIRDIFELKQTDKLRTKELIGALCDDPEMPWVAYNRGKPISPRQVAKRLSEYKIYSKTIRFDWDTAKGYEREQFEKAFSYYLSSPQSESQRHKNEKDNDFNLKDVTDTDLCDVAKTLSVTPKPAPDTVCDVVTDRSKERERKFRTLIEQTKERGSSYER